MVDTFNLGGTAFVLAISVLWDVALRDSSVNHRSRDNNVAIVLNASFIHCVCLLPTYRDQRGVLGGVNWHLFTNRIAR